MISHYIIAWLIGAFGTFFVVPMLMPYGHNRFVVCLWSLFLWPIYLPLCIYLALRNP